MIHEFLSKLGGDPNAMFGMLFNLLIIAAVGGLWLMWARNMKRQKSVEGILAATSAQLEEATRHLESALQEIHRLQGQRESEQPTADSAAQHSAATAYPARAYRQAQRAASPEEDAAQADPSPATAPAATADATTKPPAAGQPVASKQPAAANAQAVNDAEQILRLHRLGKTAEQIAAQTEMPLARINLLLRLYEQRSGGAKAAR